MPCIYKITNNINEKFYVGSTQKPKLSRRMSEHLSDLRKNKHCNKHLQSAWNKYGEENFEFIIIEEFLFPLGYKYDYIYEYIMGRELYWIELLKPEYNICREITGGKLGRKLSDYEKSNISKRAKGRKHTEESIEKIKEARAKQVITEEHKKRISRKLKGRIVNIGNKHSKETIQKRVDSRKRAAQEKGYYFSDEWKERMRKLNLGKKMSDESRSRMSISQKNRKRLNKHIEVFNLKSEFIGEYRIITEAIEKLNLPISSVSNICKVLNGKYKFSHGYIFKYKEII